MEEHSWKYNDGQITCEKCDRTLDANSSSDRVEAAKKDCAGKK